MSDEHIALPEKDYDVILVDPPWSYYSWDKNTGPQGRTAAKHYNTMSIEEICELPVGGLARENCAMFMWAVWPDIYRSQEVMNAWGFRYATVAWVWAKLNPSSIGFHYGLGYYTRANTEPCMLAIRGSMPPAVKDVQALIVEPVREHSRKPDSQYGKIERLYPSMDYIELFARSRWSDDWDVWGNEAPEESVQ